MPTPADRLRAAFDALRDATLAALDQPATPPGDDEPPPPKPVGKYPSDVLDLRNWTIMLPTGGQGDPDNEYIIGRSIPGTFYVDGDGAVVFAAPAGGSHSPNSKYARCEARQMVDADWTKAAWPSSGSHALEAELAIDTSGLVKRPRINGLQCHNGADDVLQIMRHETQGLGMMHNDGKSWEPIDPSYSGQRFTCRIEFASDRVRVLYNGAKKVDVAKKSSGNFWKVGCYLQSDVPNWGESPSAVGRVKVWRMSTEGGAT
jgi:hypothetical protein